MELNKIKDIISLFEDSNVAKLEIEIDDLSLKLEKFIPVTKEQVIQVPISEHINNEVKEIKADVKKQCKEEVKSPLVGTFYRASALQDQAFVEVGSRVNEGDILCIIEAMKVMNEIKAPCSGVIEAIHASNADMVQFDELLFSIGE